MIQPAGQTWLGIDPGLDGALASIRPNGEVVIFDMPTVTIERSRGKKREYDCASLTDFLRAELLTSRVAGSAAVVVIEHQQPMPHRDEKGKEQQTGFHFPLGLGYGITLGIASAICRIYGGSLEVVRPRSWKGHMLRDMGRDKGISIVVAQRLFPAAAEQLRRKKDHGRAEALLIAEYVRRRRASFAGVSF